MRTPFYTLTLLFIFCSLAAQATVIRVNNRETQVPEENLYDNLEDAYNKAVAGDTLYVEGSPDGYGSLTLTKPLTIIGPGYFLTENPNTQTIKQVASVVSITFDEKSEGSKISGIKFQGGFTSTRVNIKTNNIKISNCYFEDQILINNGTFEDISITQCYFANRAIDYWYYANPPIDLYFANNIVLGTFEVLDGASGTLINNVFGGDVFYVGTTSALEIHNNILLSTEAEEVTIPPLGTNISHNIAALQQFGTDNDNQANIGEAQIFVSEGTSDGKWQILEGGSADGTGRDGYDIGAFGGPNPYRLSGLPSIPRITDLSTDGYVNEDGELLIEIQVTAN